MRSTMERVSLFFSVIAIIMVMVAVDVGAEAAVDFHGYFESNLILRDENGYQYGFMDNLNAIQQRNTLKFDIDVDPDIEWGNFRIANIHLTFRGAYDSIFDLRKEEYRDIPDQGGPSRFDYGLEDIRFESDLREAYIDFTYRGELGSFFFRPGRQIVSWGEASGRVLLDVINPSDNSFQMFFLNPDDLKIPLWMGRLNYSLPPMPRLSVNFDMLWIPDIRPTQFAPMDHSMQAPYSTFLFQGLKNYNIRQDVPTDKNEYGAKVTADIGDKLSVSVVYFRDIVSDSAIVMKDFVGRSPTTVVITHPEQDVYGGFLSYNLISDWILKGEFSHLSRMPISIPTPDRVMGEGGMELNTFRTKPVDKWLIGVSKAYLVKWLAPHQNTSFNLQWIHEKIRDFDDKLDSSTKVAEDMDLFTFNMNLYWFEGRINPFLQVTYVPPDGGSDGTFLVNPSISYNINSNLYAKFVIMSFWGDKNNRSPYSSMIGTSEATLKVGYQW